MIEVLAMFGIAGMLGLAALLWKRIFQGDDADAFDHLAVAKVEAEEAALEVQTTFEEEVEEITSAARTDSPAKHLALLGNRRTRE